MTVETKLPFDKEYVGQFSKERSEPDWMKELRLRALEQAETLEMPKPDKTNITRWNFSRFKHNYVEGDTLTSLDNLPSDIKDFFDEDNAPENLLIQRNQSVALHTLSQKIRDKGVIYTTIFTARRNHEYLVKRHYMQDAIYIDVNLLIALHAALMNGGIFIYAPKNVQIEETLEVIFWQE